MNWIKSIAIAVAGLFISLPRPMAQPAMMSLQDCIEYALAHATEVRKAGLEAARSTYQMERMKAGVLPEVTVAADAFYNFARPVDVAPGERFDSPERDVPIRFGKPIQAGLGIEVRQPLLNATIATGREGQQKLEQLNELRLRKAREDVALEVAKTYFQTLIVGEKRGLLEANLDQVKGLYRLVERQYQNGFAKEIDVKRLQVNRSNLETRLNNLTLQYEQLLQVLKYRMAMPLDSGIALVDTLSATPLPPPVDTTAGADLNRRTEIALLQLRGELDQLQVERLQNERLPNLFLWGRLNLTAWGDTFSEWWGADFWYGDSFLGLRMEYPLFDGYRTRARVQQARIDGELNAETLAFTRRSLQLQYNAARQQLRVNFNELEQLRANREVAEEVFAVTQQRYAEGVAPIMELLSAETSMREAQTNYLTALLEAKQAELELWAARGELLERVAGR